ncbi:ShlB/FhaC/HecB family hemolysin secretion/activation protein [Pararobbsia silviterrae]|nr:ShlB/FhaC/HecB family hemolysin secretion/activation protein [Pararobbsia silviterrae]
MDRARHRAARGGFRGGTRFAGVALMSGLPMLAVAAPLDDRLDGGISASSDGTAAAQILRDREQHEARARMRTLAAPDVRGAPAAPVTAPAVPQETPCFAIERFVLEVPDALPDAARRAGASALPQDPFAFAADWLERYRGHCIGEQGVSRIAQGLGAEILSRGYVTTRIRVPAQTLSEHVLRLYLIPGVIRAIRFSDPGIRASWHTAFPVRAGDTLRLDDIEQALVRFRHVPGQDAHFTIEPADAPGQSDIVIAIERERPWHVAASVDNSGFDATGKLQGTVSMRVDNPLGLNDRASASLSHDLMLGQKDRASSGWTLFYAVPYGFWLASIHASGSRYARRFVGRRGVHVTTGDSTVVEWQLARHLMRTHAATLELQFRLGRRFGHAYLGDTELDVQRDNRTYVQWALAERHHLGAAQIDTMVAWRQGTSWFGARRDRSDAGRTDLYRMALLDTNVSIPFAIGSQPWIYTTAWHGQWTPDSLYDIDQLAIGMRWTVRGFDGERVLTGERGFYWRNDLAMPIGGHAIYVGADYGHVARSDAPRHSPMRLAGAVVGVRGAVGAPVATRYDVYAGVPLWKPKGWTTAAPTVGFQIACEY